MIKKLQSWQVVQRFLDIRSGIVLTFLVINSAVMGWYCVKRGKDFPGGYVAFLATVFAGVTVGKTAKVIKGQDEDKA
jgi:hypothetical protein